jgi:hypothetical protein
MVVVWGSSWRLGRKGGRDRDGDMSTMSAEILRDIPTSSAEMLRDMSTTSVEMLRNHLRDGSRNK